MANPRKDEFGNWIGNHEERFPGIVDKCRQGDIAGVKAKLTGDNLDVDARYGVNSYTLLWFAFAAGEEDMVRYLVEEESADINTRDLRHFNLLFLSIYQHRSVAEMSLLVDCGIDVNMKIYDDFNKISMTAMRYAVRYLEEERALEICELLLKAGAVITDEVHVAIRRQFPRVVARMIAAGALPSIQTLEGPPTVTEIYKMYSPLPSDVQPRLSALETALCHGNEEIVDLLLTKMFLLPTDLKLGCRFRNWKMNKIDFKEEDLFLQPWSLMVSSFVKVSGGIGFGSTTARREKVSNTDLPALLKRKLLFDASNKK